MLLLSCKQKFKTPFNNFLMKLELSFSSSMSFVAKIMYSLFQPVFLRHIDLMQDNLLQRFICISSGLKASRHSWYLFNSNKEYTLIFQFSILLDVFLDKISSTLQKFFVSNKYYNCSL
ncbi:hypothetical protein TTHERM_000607289 (macronuclear) [Tetrahymena thermophila SB210]|uniref:Uncharacterized protein n=1 Tax=Tetrahymena thermophila (strain SB210) TaxID=312017 RepID=W7XDZ1_TETTS|nr:hypothetical protein TTHERM_000607289 [Tetrahymena thermophila SB210]EWS75822.1 hypothetical protein TTHERM_000607289 [Tetrahymena thermophila SB210]|eukprot:XP_012651636.1 hypothetical protein TTHERM_000607289 [Tetrahymena thermophila SB210]